MPQISFADIFPVVETTDYFHKDFKVMYKVLLAVLPKTLRLVNGVDFLEKAIENFAQVGARSEISTFYNGVKKAREKSLAIANNIIRYCVNNNAFDFFQLEDGVLLIEGVRSVVEKLNDEQLSDYTDDINRLIEYTKISKDHLLAGIKQCKIIESIQQMDLIHKLARLVVVASTWPLWAEYEKAGVYPVLDTLTSLIISKNELEKSALFIDADIDKREEQELAYKLLNDADRNYSQGKFNPCLVACSRILALVNAADNVKGKAYYYVVKCIEEHGCSYDEYYDKEEFIRLSLEFGCKEASEEWSLPQISSLVYTPTHGLQSIDAPKLIIYNTNNAASLAFLSSIPEEYLSDGRAVYVNSTAELLNSIRLDSSTLLLLADNDLQLNFSQFLSFLDYVHATDKDVSSTAECMVYLRTDENRYSSLIDLALKHVQEKRIKVHLIDDSRIAAQQLLSRHPLFYPIQSLSAETLNTVETVINYVVVADDSNELCEWLVREAFWMGCFTYRCLSLNIKVLSPNAEKLERVIRGNYPGMFNGLESLDAVSKVNVRFESIADVESNELELRLNELAKNNSYYYCVAALQDSIRGLNLSRRLREWSIRKKLRYGADMIGVTDLPIIAFYCEDDTTAHLANMISVQSIDKGNRWYNNYRLIPFGMHGEIYSWYNLLGNITEETASCVHLQYCGVATDADRSVIEKELEGFYYRVYNRDSSMAVAASLPYRLFHMPYRDTSTENSADHIVPRGWSILNGNAYTDIQSLSRMAKMFEQGLENISNIELLTTYEHARWARWALSRGWIAATPNEAVTYMICGNPKQQLFIARMHACICSVDDLALLQKTLYEELGDERCDAYAPVGVNKDVYDRFIVMDRQSIVSTPHLLMRTWLHSKSNKD